MSWKTSWRVVVNGVDMSDRMNPFLESLEVRDRDGAAADTARLEFDDSYGRMILPPKGASVSIDLEGVNVFAGVVDEVECFISRGGGRHMTVGCKGFDARGKVKQSLHFHKDDATLGAFLADAARRAGISGVRVDPQFATERRTYWSADRESFLHLGRRLAKEFGATFKIRQGQAVFAARGAGLSPGGGAMPTVEVTVGVNLIHGHVTPFQGRERHTKARAHWYDRKKAAWHHEDVEIDDADGGPEVTDHVRHPKADQAHARRSAVGRKVHEKRERGSSSVVINLAVHARAEGTAIISGWRAGIDGPWRIAGVTHRLNRSEGAETTLELREPGGSVGKDARKPAKP
jgi:uncharacterized protein